MGSESTATAGGLRVECKDAESVFLMWNVDFTKNRLPNCCRWLKGRIKKESFRLKQQFVCHQPKVKDINSPPRITNET